MLACLSVRYTCDLESGEWKHVNNTLNKGRQWLDQARVEDLVCDNSQQHMLATPPTSTQPSTTNNSVANTTNTTGTSSSNAGTSHLATDAADAAAGFAECMAFAKEHVAEVEKASRCGYTTLRSEL